MTTTTLPLSSIKSALQVDAQTASAVAAGLRSQPKRLPSWLFYDEAGSRLFDQITHLPEYYLTRTERAIFACHAAEIIALAAGPDALHLVELGAGSADKTRLLLQPAVDRQDTLVYEPVDVSAYALEDARERIEREISGVLVCPRVEDYTRELVLDPPLHGHRRLVLYIGSSIGNFDPPQAQALLASIRAAVAEGDSVLLGVDLVKDRQTLLDAYDDAAGVTAAFNRNILHRLNRELGANFDPEAFLHLALWNAEESRMEMHLESRAAQSVRIPAIDLRIRFREGETIHTENSYKYRPTQPEAMLSQAGFTPTKTWTDEKAWFAVCLAKAT
jgi:dimethylhistidine N-methyltransferase